MPLIGYARVSTGEQTLDPQRMTAAERLKLVGKVKTSRPPSNSS
jgi:DNA invertase Pin-like site-specific DNA recombinase